MIKLDFNDLIQRGLAEKSIGWPRYSYGMWSKWGLFFNKVSLWSTHDQDTLLVKKVIDNRYDVSL